jgi:hypothetical protein
VFETKTQVINKVENKQKVEQLNEEISNTLITDQDLSKTIEVVIIKNKRKVNERVLKVDSVAAIIEVKVEKQEELDWIPMITQIKEKRLRKEWKSIIKNDYIYSYHIIVRKKEVLSLSLVGITLKNFNQAIISPEKE